MTPARGRRLSEERSEDILEVVLELLKEVGYDQLRMQDVAERAGAGLATIYRRWPTKQDLVRASLECERAQEKLAVTDDPRADVRAFLARMARDLSGDGAQTMMGFLSSCRTDPEVATVFRETALARMHDFLVDRLAAELGADFPDLDLRAAAGPAILFYQAAVCGQPIDPDAMADRLTALLFAPLAVDIPQ
jgi:AcrR family transcriptional regulator